MATRIAALLLILMTPAALAGVETGFSVAVVAMTPESGATLRSGDGFYVRIQYQSDQPLRFRLEGDHSPPNSLDVISSTAPLYPTGNGEAIAWLAYREPWLLREAELHVANRYWKTLAIIPVSTTLHWSTQGETMRPPAWVSELISAQQQLTQEQLEAAHQGNGGSTLILLMGWSVPVYIIMQIVAWRRFRTAPWRNLARLPLLVSAPVALWTLFALLAGSNLWPLVMLFTFPVCLIFLLLVWLANLYRGQASHFT